MAKTEKIALKDTQLAQLTAVGETWTKISPDAEAAHGWLIHWRAYPKLAEAGLIQVKVKESLKTGKEVLAKLTAKGKKAITAKATL